MADEMTVYEVENHFRDIIGRTCKAMYLGEKPMEMSEKVRHTFEIDVFQNDVSIREDLLTFKTLMNDNGIWSGISNGDKEYIDMWDACVWCQDRDISGPIPTEGSRCIIQFKGIRVFPNPNWYKMLVNMQCAISNAMDQDDN